MGVKSCGFRHYYTPESSKARLCQTELALDYANTVSQNTKHFIISKFAQQLGVIESGSTLFNLKLVSLGFDFPNLRVRWQWDYRGNTITVIVYY